MSFTFFNLTTVISQYPNQGCEKILTVTADENDKRVKFNKVEDTEVLESATPGYFERDKIEITPKQGFDECQSDSKCREFMQFWMSKGYKIDK